MKKIILFVCLLVVFSAAASAACLENMQAKSTEEFLNNIVSLNAQLDNCVVPSPADKLFKNAVVSIKIFMQGGKTEPVTIMVQDGKITKIERIGANKPTHIIGIGECELDTILRNNNRVGVLAYLYGQNKIQMSAVGFMNKIKFGIAKMGLKLVLGKLQTPAEITCSTAAGTAASKKKVGEVCAHGGECETGNCVGIGQGPPWTYECSCDPFKYVAADTDGKCPPKN